MTRTNPAVSTWKLLVNEVAANFESWDAYQLHPCEHI